MGGGGGRDPRALRLKRDFKAMFGKGVRAFVLSHLMGDDGARCDDVHADALVRVVERGDWVSPMIPGLRCDVHREFAEAASRRPTPCSRWRPHRSAASRGSGLHPEKGAAQVRADAAIELAGVDLGERREPGAVRRVVEGCVEAAEGRQRALDEVLDRGVVPPRRWSITQGHRPGAPGEATRRSANASTAASRPPRDSRTARHADERPSDRVFHGGAAISGPGIRSFSRMLRSPRPAGLLVRGARVAPARRTRRGVSASRRA